ncbi:glycine/sarcosine/betaine reductase selenoprotein B family protein [Chloroflexus sp.]|uniref:glycine/sarcosine/betaine reductase selenoprotein B family protein n=1 Tax=Chloroflexus sp. TaxID=1904827 RepID=UPI0026343A13|nr:glycine/sarcosine/betaine reductase selenoprotein B family protein [uncultured Chloroflexus sp.]
MTDDWRNRSLKDLYRLTGQIFSQIPALARLWGSAYRALNFDSVPFTPLRKPLNECRLALVTTGGVHRRDQPPFDMVDPRGDPTYRRIPVDTPLAELTITHDYYDHTDAEADLNILFPLELAQSLVRRGLIGSLATSYSFMGHIEPPHLETLLRQTAPEVAMFLKQEQVDAVLLTPA